MPRIVEHGMFGGEALLRIVKGSGFLRGELKSFERTDRFVLIQIRLGIVQSFNPIPRKHSGVLLRSAFRGCDHTAAALLERGNRAAASAGCIDDELPFSSDAITQRRQIRGGNIWSDQIELVFDAVVAAMADQHHHEIIIRLGLASHLAQHVRQARSSRIDCHPACRREHHSQKL